MLFSSRSVRHFTLLRKTLAREGCRPRSTSDSEVRLLDVDGASELDRVRLVVGGISRCVSSFPLLLLFLRDCRAALAVDPAPRNSLERARGCCADGGGAWTVMLVIGVAAVGSAEPW